MPPAECGSWHCWNRRSCRWCRPAGRSRNGWHLSARSTTRETKLRPRTSSWQARTDKTTGDSPTAPLPAGAFDRAVSDIDTYFQVELGAMQHWNISTEGLKDIRHPVLSMRGSADVFWLC